MPLEIEIKLKLDSHELVLKKLREVDAEHLGTVRETNIFFDRPDHSLRAADTGLRVRFSKSHGESEPHALLTFKGSPQATGLRSREAFDLTLTPHDQIVSLLNALGFQQIMLFEKDRDSWKLDECLIELDTLPYFGHFMEIEGRSESAVQSVQRKLDLSSHPPHRDSYSKMLAEYLKSNPTVDNALRFSTIPSI